MMEKVEFPEYDPGAHRIPKPWATTGKPATRNANVITSLHIQPEKMEQINLTLQRKYRQITEEEVRFEAVQTEDADILVVAYGLVARIAHKAVQLARESGLRIGLLRPITLYPFPYEPIARLAERVSSVLVVEMNSGQMVEDVRLGVEGRVPVKFHGRMGGIIPSPEEILDILHTMAGKKVAHHEEVS
jgi:2-oxoglutarate ferredoxin oxidoreductase subunit alpha